MLIEFKRSWFVPNIAQQLITQIGGTPHASDVGTRWYVLRVGLFALLQTRGQ